LSLPVQNSTVSSNSQGKRELNQHKFFMGKMPWMRKRPCNMQVSMIGKISFLKAIKKFRTQLSPGKTIASVFWDSEEVTHVSVFHMA
jgi:hypothetical protein